MLAPRPRSCQPTWTLPCLSKPLCHPCPLLPAPPRPRQPQGTTNFAVFASNAWGVSLCLFTEADLRAGRVTHEVALHPEANKTGDTWHIALPRLDSTLLYGYRVFGANEEVHEECEGQRYDPVSGAAVPPLPPPLPVAAAAGSPGLPAWCHAEMPGHGLATCCRLI